MADVRDVLTLDPQQTTLPNDGVTQVVEPSEPEHFDVLRWELKSFVCQGEFERGLGQILASYLSNLGQTRQPAVWVSGFYGSGKSHLVRVLEFLWRDYELPDGARASSLVVLPNEIRAYLRELSTAGRRQGGLWAAAGKLTSGRGSVRLRLLQVVMKSAGLPTVPHVGRFVLWLHAEGVFEAFKQHIESAGSQLEDVLADFYVSPLMARALSAVKPDLGSTEREIRGTLRDQFRDVDDVDNDEMVQVLEQILRFKSTDPNQLPCTLIVLDELQQFIAERAEMLSDVQEVVETCTAGFQGRVLFVGTGQSAMPAHSLLSKLQDRFTVKVELRDADRDTVIRQVVLRKKPDREAEVKAVLEQCSGEIDRHLQGSRLGRQAGDERDLVADYPLLPTRRRFWDAVLRSLAAGGATSQLRTQLRVVFEGTKSVADRPLGWVIPADWLYDEKSGDWLQSAALLSDVDTGIRQLRDKTPDGRLKSRLCALIFMISKLHEDEGLRATPEALADLLVEDLRAGSAALRQQIPGLLAALVEAGQLVQIEDEYRIQTREGAEWDADYRHRYNQVLDNEVRLNQARRELLRDKLEEALNGLRFTQGASGTPRAFELHFTDERPLTDGPKVPVWIRDGWSTSPEATRSEAQTVGAESPLVTVFLPRHQADRLRRALSALLAAGDTVGDRSPAVSGDEGRDALAAMETRQRNARSECDAVLEDVLSQAVVLQGGGTEVRPNGLRDSVQAAIEAALKRLYPRFGEADHAKWSQVLTRARESNADALSQVGWSQEPDQQPVCVAILQQLGQSSATGNDLRKCFEAPPYGWPRDAIGGALAALVATGRVKATEHGTGVPVGRLDNTQIGRTTFRREGDVVQQSQRIAVRALLQKAGLPWQNNQEADALPALITKLRDVASIAGGDAPAPPPPDAGHLHALAQLSGNALIVACVEQKEQLEHDLDSWPKRAATLADRRKRWERLQQLLQHSRHLPVYNQASLAVAAVVTNRSLLADPDPVPPLAEELASALRAEFQAVRKAHDTAVQSQLDALAADDGWVGLDQAARSGILRRRDLVVSPAQDLGDEKLLLASLDDTSLEQWRTRLTAVPQQAKEARVDAAKALEPETQSFTPPPANLKTAAEVDTYLDQVRAALLEQIQHGPVVIG